MGIISFGTIVNFTSSHASCQWIRHNDPEVGLNPLLDATRTFGFILQSSVSIIDYPSTTMVQQRWATLDALRP
jgi:alkanesulfonate monooxygenase SsuD/methylene tetrahydromethanopterin reductase-like flavin-dependent oxidoreductase (luciferase family)